jgi:putative membrane protein
MMWHGTMGFGWFFWLPILVVAILLTVYIGKTQSGRKDNYSDRSMEILKERFARGEIDEEEYERKRKKLRD